MVYVEKKKGVTRLTGGALDAWPVNSVYISFSNANPASFFGGTWQSIGTGRMLIGVDPGDAAMDVAGDTGGAKTTTLEVRHLPPHQHDMTHDHPNTTGGSHNHNFRYGTGSGNNFNQYAPGNSLVGSSTQIIVLNEGDHSHNVLTANRTEVGNGSGQGLNNEAVNNLPPYLAVYMWRRTA